ncbi:hypothetical protein K439DRAFT_1547772 [Ramaria rubella]|nr:hypothetical protein K439DRAFT_1547772 [Ramaria rubella]
MTTWDIHLSLQAFVPLLTRGFHLVFAVEDANSEPQLATLRVTALPAKVQPSFQMVQYGQLGVSLDILHCYQMRHKTTQVRVQGFIARLLAMSAQDEALCSSDCVELRSTLQHMMTVLSGLENWTSQMMFQWILSMTKPRKRDTKSISVSPDPSEEPSELYSPGLSGLVPSLDTSLSRGDTTLGSNSDRAAAQATVKSSMYDICSEMFVSLPAVLCNSTVHGLFPEELGTCPTTRSTQGFLPASFLGLDSTGLRNLLADVHQSLKTRSENCPTGWTVKSSPMQYYCTGSSKKFQVKSFHKSTNTHGCSGIHVSLQPLTAVHTIVWT